MFFEAPETFCTLLRNRAHWEFEIFVTLVVDGLILGMIWPFAQKHIMHHLARDKREGVR